jgi:hypothetical protein
MSPNQPSKSRKAEPPARSGAGRLGWARRQRADVRLQGQARPPLTTRMPGWRPERCQPAERKAPIARTAKRSKAIKRP